MHIQYHGDACLRISGKQGPQEFTVLLDPYDAKQTGLKPLRPSLVDLVCSTSGTLPDFGEGPYVITGPGEYEVKSVSVIGIPVGAMTIYRLDAEDISIAHLGNCATVLDAGIVDRLGDIDVLIVPVGGQSVFTAKQANDIVEQIEPRVVIPIQYAVRGAKLPYDGPEAFCKEMGYSPKDLADRLRLTEKDLPTEEMWVRMLEVT